MHYPNTMTEQEELARSTFPHSFYLAIPNNEKPVQLIPDISLILLGSLTLVWLIFGI